MISAVLTPTRARSTERSLRNATLPDLATRLDSQQQRKVDVVAPARAIRAQDGMLIVEQAERRITAEGVTSVAGTYEPTGVCESGIADKLGVPLAYLRRLRAEAPHLYDANVNEWLGRDGRKFLVRALSSEDGGTGQARAFLSNGYKIIDNYDVLTAVLDGVRQAGVQVDISSCDLSDQRMYVRLTAPEIRGYAPYLLRNYRSPYSGRTGADNPTVFAGLLISNSETGCGSLSMTPQLTVQICDNGMPMTKDVVRAVHLGAKLDEGRVEWSDDTQRKTLAVYTAQARDTVRRFLDREYVEANIREIEKTSGAPVADVEETIKSVSKTLRFTEEQRKGIFDHFVRGGDLTAGGVMHAVTSYAQTVQDPDDAHELGAQGIRAMELAAAA
jgi:hypothetical protein